MNAAMSFLFMVYYMVALLYNSNWLITDNCLTRKNVHVKQKIKKNNSKTKKSAGLIQAGAMKMRELIHEGAL